jgi:hypothetical protein
MLIEYIQALDKLFSLMHRGNSLEHQLQTGGQCCTTGSIKLWPYKPEDTEDGAP